ncbi:efflux RND transporter permease subunit [Luteolibacter sp. LG18]|uniref:efflux RND transporter permease subunit n=1 Tax=Luteolibacter sp. LG18 TaxID=2819286 RepID=UPI002B32354C|nr:RND transporter [Luteolibacter sp. LG18]
MWIVLFALRYKYTIGVFAILVLLFGVMSSRKMSTDILPRVETPEITLVWNYGGLNATEMASKITSFSEIATLNNVDDLVEVRSETSNGVALVKMRFQPYADINTALSQVTAVSQTILRRMPTGTTPPLIIRTSPSSVPIVQLVISSDTMTGGQLFDYSRLALRAKIQSIPGLRLSLPYGGAARQVMVDLDPDALNAFGLSAADVSRAIGTQNLTLPSGLLREGERELPVTMNASPETVQAFLDLPIRSVNGKMILLRDVANVRDGEAVSTNPARLNGQNAVMVSVLKLGSASTVDVVNGILSRMDEIRKEAPPGMTIEPIFDQSVFVKAAVDGVLKEILLVGGLVALVVLLFLGSWRSTLIVLTSIPLALLCSIMGLYLVGATFNLMTLGGLSLAIGILVDNALVEIENIKRQIALGKGVRQAIIDGARQVAFPEFVSTLSICIVFLPIFLLSGTASYVFRPLALAVVFSMLASYLLSRTLVPTLASLMLPAEVRKERELAKAKPRFGLFRIHHGIEHGVDRLSEVQGGILGYVLRHRWLVLVPILIAVAIGVFAGTHAGREFFPKTDAGLLRLFIRVPPGGRVEDTGAVMAEIQREIRTIIPKDELSFVVENIGAPNSVNLAWVESTSNSSSDGEILVQLADHHHPTLGYEVAIRDMLTKKFPQVQSFFRPADATSQTLASGSPTTFEVRFTGRDVPGNLALAKELKERFKQVPGAVDITLREVLDQPGYVIRVDRARAAYLGVTQQDAANALLAALGSGGTVSPSFWADPEKGASYDVQVLAQPSELKSTEQLLNLPIRPSAGGNPVLLRSFATLVEQRSPASVSRTTLQPTLTLVANVQGRDLGSVTRDLEKILDDIRAKLKNKPGNEVHLFGQAALMQSAYAELLGGLGLAAVLVFLVMVINFQSWSLPFVAISGLPLAVSGAVAALWLTGTPLSVPALMGVIMVVGVSTANSVLVSSFARDRQVLEGATAAEAAMDAATTRLRPVMMTALAMILGVIPMALGHGEGGEQNAPLGRAVIGGLVFGTFASLFVVPTMFAIVRRRWKPPVEDEDSIDSEEPTAAEPA